MWHFVSQKETEPPEYAHLRGLQKLLGRVLPLLGKNVGSIPAFEENAKTYSSVKRK